MSEREAGYYWVRHWQFHDWHIAEKTLGGGWLLTGMAMSYDDDDMEEIGPRIPSPEDPWKCVPVEPTADMMQSGYWSGAGDVSVNEEWARREVWRRMLSSAPKP